MAEILDSLETGEQYANLKFPAWLIPFPSLGLASGRGAGHPDRLPQSDRKDRVESGPGEADRPAGSDRPSPIWKGLCFITVVEKALQLAQVVASELGVRDMAVAYNRVKPHMETSRRPVIQVGADSVTSGIKFLALYERDINLLVTRATRGVIIIDDVVTTGGTISGLLDLLDQMAQLKKFATAHPRPWHLLCR